MRRLIRVGDDVSALPQFCQGEPPGLRLIHPHVRRELYTFGLRVMTNDGELIVDCAETRSQACAVRQTTLHQKGEGEDNRHIIFIDDTHALLLPINGPSISVRGNTNNDSMGFSRGIWN